MARDIRQWIASARASLNAKLAPLDHFLKQKWRQLLLFLTGTVIMGHFGILPVLAMPLYTNETAVGSLLRVLRPGGLYIVAIAIVSSTVIPLVQSAMRDKFFRRNPDSIALYVLYAVVTVALLALFGGMNAAFDLQQIQPGQQLELKDKFQIALWLAGLAVSLVLFIRYISQAETDTFSEDEDKRRDVLKEGATVAAQDSRGMSVEG